MVRERGDINCELVVVVVLLSSFTKVATVYLTPYPKVKDGGSYVDPNIYSHILGHNCKYVGSLKELPLRDRHISDSEKGKRMSPVYH